MKRNDRERELWVLNYEPLYCWWKETEIGITMFIRKNRKEIDVVIDRELDKKPNS